MIVERTWLWVSSVVCAANLFAQYNYSKSHYARPPGNSAEGIPDGVSWAVVIAFAVLAYWLYSITPKKRSQNKP